MKEGKVGRFMQRYGLWMVFVLLGLLIWREFGSYPRVGDSEARGQLKQLEITRANDRKRIAILETDRKSLLEKNRRLEVKLAAVEGGKGSDLEEQQQFLDNRKAELDRLKNQLIARDEIVAQRESRVVMLEKEFYEKTNMTMTDLGEARHIKDEYENMRAEKNAAIQKVDWWLKIFTGVSIALLISLVGIFFALVRSYFTHTAQRSDIQDIHKVIHVVDKRLEGIEDQR